MINRYAARVESCDRRDSYAWLRLGRGRLAARLWPGIRKGQRIDVRIAPEDVIVCAEHPGRVSARNILAGHVDRVRHVPEGVYVTMDVGFPLTAFLMRRGARELRIRKGAGLYAVVKAVSVIPEVAIRAGVRVSIQGPNGLIGHEKIDFLRAIDRAGSISAAAREAGVTYRTAWHWAEAMNRAWGHSLVARTHGGHGGGGAVLTPAARAVLALASRIERGVANIPAGRTSSIESNRGGVHGKAHRSGHSAPGCLSRVRRIRPGR